MSTCSVCNQNFYASSANQKFCSLNCSTKYTGSVLRTNSQPRAQQLRHSYMENPNHCKVCQIVIDFGKRKQPFCSRSCAAKYNNQFKSPPSQSSIEKMKLTLLKTREQEYLLNPKYCQGCNATLTYSLRRRKFCNKTCAKMKPQRQNNLKPRIKRCVCAKTGEVFYSPVWRKYSSSAIYEDLILYRQACNFNFTITHKFPDYDLLLEHGWYHPTQNPHGISRDHKFSVTEGFKLGIDPSIISHPANCQLMLHRDNQRKHKHSSINLQELIVMIEHWT